MTSDTPTDNTPAQPVSETLVRMYYEHQYDRLRALETQRLTLTIIVVATSAAAFALDSIGDRSSILSAVVPVIVAAFNLFAVAYIIRIAGLLGVHDKRAKLILERFARPIYDLDRSLPFPTFRNRFGGRSNIHLYVHIAIASIAILLLIARAVIR